MMAMPLPPAPCALAVMVALLSVGCFHGTKAGAAEALFRRDTKCTDTYVEKIRQSHVRVSGCGEARYYVCRRAGHGVQAVCQEESVYAATNQTIARTRLSVTRRKDRTRGLDVLKASAADQDVRLTLLAVPAVEPHTLQLTLATAQPISACDSLEVTVDGAPVETSDAELHATRWGSDARVRIDIAALEPLRTASTLAVERCDKRLAIGGVALGELPQFFQTFDGLAAPAPAPSGAATISQTGTDGSSPAPEPADGCDRQAAQADAGTACP